MNPTEIIKRPIVTEKSSKVGKESYYAFEVDKEANVNQIKEAVKALFGVEAIKIQTATIKGELKRLPKSRRLVRKPSWKKAYVKVEKGKKIDIFEKVKS